MSFRLIDMIMGKNSYSKICVFIGINAHVASFDLTRPIVLSAFIGEAKELGNQTNQPVILPGSALTNFQDYRFDWIFQGSKNAWYLKILFDRTEINKKEFLNLTGCQGIHVTFIGIPRTFWRRQVLYNLEL